MFEEIVDDVFEVELSGRTFKVCFTMNSLKFLEKHGLDLDDIQGRGLPVYERSVTMLTAGTRDFHGDPDKPGYVTEDGLGLLMRPWQLSAVNNILDQAIVAAYTPKKKVEKEPATGNPTGS
jgi:hypothetical protein